MEKTEERTAALRRKLLKRIAEETDTNDGKILEIIDELIMKEGREAYISLQEKQRLRTELFNSIRRLDILQELLDDDTVTEIMVNGTEGIFIERLSLIHI